uniref:ULP_PROTEASE domain-containing protein n=1 Tax=Strongyloides papillosus TaxID=174720 RepID=A0A0N5B6C1_STREA
MGRKKVQRYNGEFKSDNEMVEMFRIYINEVWKDRGNNFDIVQTKTVYANGKEIKLSSNVFLLNELIIICAVICGHEYISVKQLSGIHVSKVEVSLHYTMILIVVVFKFLNNSEKKGAAIILTIPSKSFWMDIKTWITPESLEHDDESFNKIILTIPIMNSNSKSLYGITRRLHEFCSSTSNSNSSYKIPFININFYELEMRVSPFKLKPISQTSSNDSCGEQVIVFMRDDYSNKTSDRVLTRLSPKAKKPVKEKLCNIASPNLKIIKDGVIFEKYVNARIFRSKNVETNETYDIHGKAFCSLFQNEWLHSDIVDSYLNEWRMRMKKQFDDYLNNNKARYKIYNTLLYTRLTRGMTRNSTKDLDDSSLHQLQMNADKISNEKVYSPPTVFASIFDFNCLIVPIHATNHWLTGIIYQPRNCLKRKYDDSSMESENNFWTYIIIYDSLTSSFFSKNEFHTFVLIQYIKACSRSLKEKYGEGGFYFDEGKIKIVELKDVYRQNNGNDCGLYMLEFIRQVCINPDSLGKLANGQSMKDVFPTFNSTSGRSYLKLFVYSRLTLKDWPKLYEMEEYYLTKVRKKKFRRLQTRSYECIDWNGKKHTWKSLTRARRHSV